jgi:hypothetical protein
MAIGGGGVLDRLELLPEEEDMVGVFLAWVGGGDWRIR